MSAEIHFFDGDTSLDPSVENVLRKAMTEGLDRVLLVGRKGDQVYFDLSYSDGPTALWDIEILKRGLIDVEVAP